MTGTAPPLWLAVWPQRAPLPAGPNLFPAEQRRLHALPAARRGQSHAANLLLGHLCAAAFSCDPACITVGRDAIGRPHVQATIPWPPAEWTIHRPAVSLSHGGGWLAACVGDTAPVGVDVEAIRPLRPAVLPEILTPHEQTEANGCPSWIIALWCLKEAWLKATGDGLRRDPREAHFHLTGLSSPRPMIRCGGAATGWHAVLCRPAADLWLACVSADPFTLRPVGCHPTCVDPAPSAPCVFGVSTP